MCVKVYQKPPPRRTTDEELRYPEFWSFWSHSQPEIHEKLCFRCTSDVPTVLDTWCELLCKFGRVGDPLSYQIGPGTKHLEVYYPYSLAGFLGLAGDKSYEWWSERFDFEYSMIPDRPNDLDLPHRMKEIVLKRAAEFKKSPNEHKKSNKTLKRFAMESLLCSGHLPKFES